MREDVNTREAVSPKPPAISDETFQSNQRLAGELAKRNGVGDLPKFTTDAINTDGAKAIPEFVDLLEQVHENDPKQAQALLSQTLQGISPEHQRTLKNAYAHNLSVGTDDGNGRQQPDKVPSNEIDPMDGASGLHGKDFGAHKKASAVVDDLGKVLDDGSRLNPEHSDAMKARIDETFPYDEDARLRAKAIVDAARTGNTDDTRNALRDLRAIANDPKRLAAQRESQAYYQAYPEETRLKYADQRGKVRGTMEQSVQHYLVNQNAISEQKKMIERHRKAAKAGDTNAKRIVDTATAKQRALSQANENLGASISKEAAAYQAIPTHPHPEIDKRGGRQHEAAENRNRTRKELAVDAALLVTGGGVAKMGKKAEGRTIAAASLKMAGAATTYTRALQEGTRVAMREAGVDFANPKAIAAWARDNPEMSAQISRFALQSATADLIGDVAGSKAGNLIQNPVGSFAAEKVVNEGVRKTFAPVDPGEQ